MKSLRISAAIIGSIVLCASHVGAQAVIDDSRRPPPLQRPPMCELWRGQARGNDPSQVIEMVLCVDGRNVRGTFQTSSLNSGWSKRTFVGTVIEPGQRMALREVEFLDNRPNSGWMFCLIDQYDLRFTSQIHLESDYHSTACRDDGHISADRIEGADAGALSASVPQDAGASEEQDPSGSEGPRGRIILVPPTQRARRRWLQCAVGAVGAESSGWLVVALTAAGLALNGSRKRARRTVISEPA